MISPLTAPTAAPSAIAMTKPDQTGMCSVRNRSPTTKAHRPSTEPTDRSTLRVTMTIVSPTPSSATRDAPTSSCWRLPAEAKSWFLMVTTANDHDDEREGARLSRPDEPGQPGHPGGGRPR